MNSNDKARISAACNGILWLWRDLIIKSGGDPWVEHTARQAYCDSIRAFKTYKIIEDYDVDNVMVKIDGIWYKRH